MQFYMRLKQQQLDDPAILRLYRDLAEAITWTADDPRVAALADRLVGLLEATESAESGAGTDEHGPHGQTEITDELAELLDSVFLTAVPMARRLLRLLEQRGWTGWTKNRRVGHRA